MPRHSENRDHKRRRRQITTPREIRQADQITGLKAEVRALRNELALINRPPPIKRTPTHAQNYHRLLDHMEVQFTRLINKGREYFGSCPHCGNVKLPCVDPLIELERIDYAAGEMDALIFAPSLGAG